MMGTLRDVHCAVNPVAGREYEVKVAPAAVSRKILVIGGGPAGMEAALTAFSRGHDVTLWEKGARLGGQLYYAAKPPGKAEFAALVDYYRNQLQAKGVKVVLNHEATVENIEAENADAVILATGARPAPLPFPVIAGDKVVSALDVLDGHPLPGKNVVIIGGGAVGCETAVLIGQIGTMDAETLKFLIENEAETFDKLVKLISRGTKNVTIIEALKGFGRDIGISTRWGVIKNAGRLGVKMINQALAKEVNDSGVIIEKDGKESLIPADHVVAAVGVRPNNELASALQGKVPGVYVIGDAGVPGKVTEAIRQGFDLAVTL